MFSTMPTEATHDPLPATPFDWKRLLMIAPLVAIAMFETWDGWDNLPVLKNTFDHSSKSGVFVVAHTLSQPVLGLAAIAFALSGRVRYAIIALAANIVLRWLTADIFNPANWRMVNFFSTQETLFQLMVTPIAALVAGALAARDTRLGLATLLVCLPTLYNIVLLVGLFISVALYGF
jgi:hypothetical protein